MSLLEDDLFLNRNSKNENKINETYSHEPQTGMFGIRKIHDGPLLRKIGNYDFE